VYEKIQEGMLAVGRSRGPLLAAISAWAKQIGTQATEAKKNNQPYPWLFCLAYVLVYRTIRAALGLDQCRAFFSGAAPLQPSTIAYFESLWMPISELYGMSESSGPQTYNVDSPGLRKSNSAGKAVPGTEMVISCPDAQGIGEICYRGRNVFMGYLYDGVKSAEAIDEFGYLHSGDLGYIDTDGFLFITGRIKELIITAGGENVPPVPIENIIKEEMPAISQAVVIGDGRKFLSVLLTLKTGVNEESGVPDCYLTGDAKAVAKSLNSPAYTVDEAIRCSRYQQYLAEGIQRVNQKAVSRAAEIRKWAVLPTDLSVAGGELTATMKIKRKEISVMYESVIDEIYRSEDI
jgi:long-chain-fatty-acid--CoA ligase ACSBG